MPIIMSVQYYSMELGTLRQQSKYCLSLFQERLAAFFFMASDGYITEFPLNKFVLGVLIVDPVTKIRGKKTVPKSF